MVKLQLGKYIYEGNVTRAWDPEQVQLSGNLITDLSDHFAQFCIMKSVRENLQK